MSSLRHIAIIVCCISLLLFTSVASYYANIPITEEEQLRGMQIGEEEKTVKIIFPSTFLQSIVEKSFHTEEGGWVFHLITYPNICKEVIIPPPDSRLLLYS